MEDLYLESKNIKPKTVFSMVSFKVVTLRLLYCFRLRWILEGEEAVEEVALYLPGLLEATVSGKWVSAHVVCVYSTISDD